MLELNPKLSLLKIIFAITSSNYLIGVTIPSSPLIITFFEFKMSNSETTVSISDLESCFKSGILNSSM